MVATDRVGQLVLGDCAASGRTAAAALRTLIEVIVCGCKWTAQRDETHTGPASGCPSQSVPAASTDAPDAADDPRHPLQALVTLEVIFEAEGVVLVVLLRQ